MNKYTYTFENGLRLIFEKNEKDVLASNILFFVGSQNESEKQEGYSHFIEHMMFKSSEKYSTEKIMDELTRLGADYNAYTSRTVTRYTFKCLSENFEECFKIYSEMILNSKFNEDEIDKERQVVIEEMKQCDDNPVEILYKQTIANYFAGTSFAHDELGTEEIISNVTRKQLLDYKHKYYVPERCVVSIAGNMEFSDAKKIVEKSLFADVKTKKNPVLVEFANFTPDNLKKYDIVERDDNQANVCVHIKSVPASSKLKYVADIYASILGNSQNSRLFKRIREELGLVYTIFASNEMRINSGELFIVFGTRPKNVKKAISEIKNIILTLASDGITADELDRAKTWKKSCAVFAVETNSDISEINGTNLFCYNKKISIDEIVENYQSVKLSDVCDFAKQIANEQNFNIVAVGKNLNIKDIEQF